MYKSTFVHVAIGWNAANLASLPLARRNQALKDIYVLADRLRQFHIPTTWVSVPLGQGAFDYAAAWDSWNVKNTKLWPQDELEKFDLGALKVRTDEALFLNSSPDVFDGGLLADWIKEEYSAKGVILTGGPTDVCIAPSLSGAARAGLHLHAVYDQMFTSAPWDSKPKEHKLTLEDEWRAEAQQFALREPLRLKNTHELRDFLQSYRL